MDEFKQTRRVGRLALLAALSCCGISVQAAEPTNSSTSSFRSLIAQGWKHSDATTTTDLSREPDVVRDVPGASAISQAVITPLSPAKPLAELIRSQPKPIEVPKLLPLADVQSDAPIRLESHQRVSPSIVNAQSIRLRESARQSLHNAQQRLRRRATHSARMYARETLRLIVAMQDAQQGGNRHEKELDAAMKAIRESRDFGGSFGAIDNKAMKQMVAVHETTTLKNQSLDDVSAIEATEAYLSFARETLVFAAGGRREASDAIVILGMVERTTASMDNAHASAVAVTLLRAASQIAPGNMTAHRELGTMLSRQGLVDQAIESLRKSLAIEPTRSGYQRLLEVSRRNGDIDTAQECIAALKSDNLPSEIPVRNISPKRFAATYRPSPASIRRSRSETTVAKSGSKSADSKPVRVGFRSLMTFGRK